MKLALLLITITTGSVYASSNDKQSLINQYGGETTRQSTMPVRGIVTDKNGEPLPGVNVYEKSNPQNGVITGVDGNYSIEVTSSDATVIFSFIGFEDQEVMISGRSLIDVTLSEEMTDLDEVVVVGYGTMKKSDLTGSVASVGSKEMMSTPLSRVDQALQGKVAGVSVTTTTGAPGGNVKIRIRGANSINGGNDPLVVIDGFLGGNLNNINPADIESIEVLKDASATAIYGSRGANGVILVSTKKGKEGMAEVSFNSYISNHKLGNSIPILKAHEYANLLNERAAIFEQQPIFTQEEVDELRINGGVDWEDEIYRKNALQHNSQLSVRGGSEKVRYYLSTTLMQQNGLIKRNEFDRLSIVSNVDADVKDWLTIGLNVQGNKAKHQGIGSNGYWGGPVDNALRYPNTGSVYNEDGSYNLDTPVPVVGAYNPVASVFEPRRLATTYTGLINAYAQFKITKELSFKTSVGAKVIKGEGNQFNTLQTLNGFHSGTNSANYNANTNESWQNTNTLSYLKTINNIHKVNATLVFEQQHGEYKTNSALVKGFPTEHLGFYNMGLGENRQKTESSFSDYNMQSFLGRVNYGLKDKYLLTVSFRADGSSKFGKDNKWAYFPSASVAWRLSEESFIKDLNVFSNFKLRTSYGVTGSQATGAYASLNRLNTGMPYPIDGTNLSSGVGPGSPANKDLSWEKTSQMNYGVDLGFMDNRISLIVDVYKKNTTDLLLYDPLPEYTGFSSMIRNIGEVENKGIELVLNASPFVNKFKWDFSMNYASNTTKILDFGNGGQTIKGEYILKEGEALGAMYGYKFLGVWQANEAEEAAVYGNVPGDSKYFDLDENGTINEDDKVIIGNGLPKFTFGITNYFSYKGIDLSAEIVGVQGNDILNARRYWLTKDLRVPENLDYYREDNQNTNVPGFSNTETDLNTTANSRFVEDGSFMRLRNVTLGYTFNKGLIEKAGLSALRLYVSGQNLWTSTDYSGFDPELSSTGSSDIKIGYDASPYPSAKIYTIGLDVKF
ncbi:MAG: TonB-dependent receptor [Carboxylicivirga sp.]|nr:TonB-dependent receptor [Carboxylicivirga sp.]